MTDFFVKQTKFRVVRTNVDFFRKLSHNMTKNNDGRKHCSQRFGRKYEKEQVQLWNFLRKAQENFGATVLATKISLCYSSFVTYGAV